jgi:Tfp pilus assembly protein PilZ
MRSIQVSFPSGREVLSSYWGFLENGGLVLREPKDLAEGESILLDVRIKSLKQTFQFAGRVVKRTPADEKSTKLFVAFNSGQDHQLMLNAAWADTHDVPQRKHRRYTRGADVRYHSPDAGAKPIRGRIIDVSPGGCRLRGAVGLPVGARVTVSALGIELEGQIRWSTPGNEMGIEFAKPELVVQAFFDEAV